MRKLWVTGKGGLLGKTLAKHAAFATGREVDISDKKAIDTFLQQHPGITHIVNCAAYSLVDLAEKEREEAFQANVVGPENLARTGIKLIHISSDYIFNGKPRHPLKETDPPEPLNHYGKTKLAGEEKILRIAPSACIIRTSWIFGAGGKNFVAKLLQMLTTQEEIRLSDDQWGRPTYVEDLAEAVLQLLDHAGVYHYANQGEATKYSFGCVMREEAIRAGLQVLCKQIIPVPSSSFPSPCKRPAYSAFDTAKVERFLKIRSWQEGLKDFLCKSS